MSKCSLKTNATQMHLSPHCIRQKVSWFVSMSEAANTSAFYCLPFECRVPETCSHAIYCHAKFLEAEKKNISCISGFHTNRPSIMTRTAALWRSIQCQMSVMKMLVAAGFLGFCEISLEKNSSQQ